VEKSYYLRTGSMLSGNPGSGPKSTADVALGSKATCSARPFAPFGTWSIPLP